MFSGNNCFIFFLLREMRATIMLHKCIPNVAEVCGNGMHSAKPCEICQSLDGIKWQRVRTNNSITCNCIHKMSTEENQYFVKVFRLLPNHKIYLVSR